MDIPISSPSRSKYFTGTRVSDDVDAKSEVGTGGGWTLKAEKSLNAVEATNEDNGKERRSSGCIGQYRTNKKTVGK